MLKELITSLTKPKQLWQDEAGIFWIRLPQTQSPPDVFQRIAPSPILGVWKPTAEWLRTYGNTKLTPVK